MSELTLLGTGTCQVEAERRASSVLIRLDETAILFDCGHGILQRLLEAGVRHDQLQHVVLSHFHPDHISDLISLMHAGAWSQRDPRTSDLHIYGPQGVRDLITGIFQLLGANSFQQPYYQVHIHEITEPRFTIADYPFEFLSLPPAGNHGLRWSWKGKRYAITGDSNFHQEELAFLTDVDMAIIDAGHISDAEISKLAAKTQARHIICSHLYRDLHQPTLQQIAEQQGYRGTIQIGSDLLTFPL
ncbi:ribonuclease Z [Ktedonobacteria bacterium brp13]|nr:ribonuclease Z [Ktedonobacteria bacterium brp13]